MAFLRVAAFDIEEPPDEGLDLWDDLMGSALRNHPECHHVLASRSGNRFLIMSQWSSAEAFAAAAASKPIVDVHLTISARLNMSPDQEPSFLYEGAVP